MAYIPAMIDLEEPETEVKQQKTFKEYYADPEYKRRHLARMQEKLECPTCNVSISRSNMSKHKKTKHHIRVAAKIESPSELQRAEIFTSFLKFFLAQKGT